MTANPKTQTLKTVLLVLIISLNYAATCQKTTKSQIFKEAKFDTSYIESYYDDFTVGLSIPQKFVNISLSDENSGNYIDYSPNTNASLGVKAAYKWLGISVGIAIPETTNGKQTYGETQKLDIQLNTYFRFLVIDAYLQSYRGMYMDNMNDYFEEFDEETDKYYKRSDLVFANLGFAVRYVTNNKRFSYKAAFDYNQKQKKRAGSLILGTYFFLNALEADSAMIPHFARDNFNEESMFTKANSTNIGISIGYIYTFIIKKHFFATLEVTPGFGLQTITALGNDETIVFEKAGLGINTTTRFSLGYSKKRFYGSIAGVFGVTNLNNEDKNTINYGYGYIRYTLGYRFNVNKTNSKEK